MSREDYWFSGLGSKDTDEAVEALRSRSKDGDEAVDLPRIAVENGYFDTEDEYYELLRDAAIELTRSEIAEESGSREEHLINALRSVDSLDKTVNLLEERVRDWKEETVDSKEGEGGDGGDVRPVESIEERLEDLRETRDETREFVRSRAYEVAPNLSELAGPVLASRLIALAGGLENLARKPSSTLQVLGAEDALFRHLRDGTPPPKHGVIYLHPYVRNTSEEDRGRA
ncbi:MAG: hypothetical protein SV760_03710, partial [Halobacteria archaeon]|nr:hypothetical protein [Halobacteria archaeon]